ncbi:MAG: hypothetical protein K2F70_06510, partial [Muribaculaceae bacterium]|nr:hypothetical protein [Muribaculaceae bacterium]
MKKQLRNIAFAAAVLACGSAVAQDAPAVLTPAWQQTVTASGSTNVRLGQGFGGKIYMADKGGKIIVADGTTQEDYVVDERITGIGLTIDQKGNIIVNRNFPNASSGVDYLLIDTEKNITELTLPKDEMEEPARTDQLGRAIGDFMSEEGGVFYICPNALNAVYGVSIVNGEIQFNTFGFSASD